ncbi:MAG: Sec-independent protein translocase protein TatB [Microvirga sp.]|jgi:sec-independent protein translocase protein TatB|uniref:Sec-independent protein translocase protein TatB n=1 Tax=Microvirga tunisiensis TaxID=2108360 RepID=A0A5N7MBK3_9HYPH|nr:Sec-independent protein translocase protein TatB [Microvirga tunisiensis]MPR05900.1 twin-arginine translocase subunit TatB [Microvirga tunisiensis]MPR24235.1 twin-arginine translocase subunit TatB [Microvirga tunisiensis]
MLDMSWGEIMVIGAVALIVIGPKDLPKALRTIGQVTGKLRRMAAEFQGQFNEAMREAELDEVKKQLQGVNDSVTSVGSTNFNPIQTIRDELKTSIEAPEKAPEPGAVQDVAQVTSDQGSSDPAPAQPTSDSSVQAVVEGRAPDPTDPLIDLPPPPTVDPAKEIAESLRREAEYEAQQAALAEQLSEKSDAKAG